MLDEAQVSQIISEAVNIIQDAKKSKKGKDGKFPLPEFNPIYVDSVLMAERISVHADGDKFPDLLFKTKAPNETAEEFEYRKGIYKSRTHSYWEDAMGTVNRIWNPSNYTIEEFNELSQFESNPPEEYILKDYPAYNSLIKYFESVVTDFKIKDPNAVLAVKPREIPKTLDEDGNLVNDETELIEPIAIVYEAKQIVQFRMEVNAVILLEEKSIVSTGNRKVREGLIFELYDKDQIWRATQIGDKNKFTFEIELYYEHNLGYLPVWKLGGKPVQKLAQILFKSYFLPAVPNLDAAALNYSNLDISIYNHAFPQRWELVEDCTVCTGNGFTMHDNNRVNCDKCEGVGRRPITSPTGIKQIKMPSRTQDTQIADIPLPPSGYIAPDTQILTFLQETIDNDLVQAFLFVNIPLSNTRVQGSETALGKMIDREELFSFLFLIASESFELLKNSMRAIGQMRYADFELQDIKAPVSFEIRSEQELIEEIEKAKIAGLPSIAIAELLKDFMRKRFNNNTRIEEIIDTVFKVDALILDSQQDILMKLSSGQIQKWEAVLHNNIFKFLEDEDLETEGIEERLEQRARQMATEQVTTQSILDNANASPTADTES